MDIEKMIDRVLEEGLGIPRDTGGYDVPQGYGVSSSEFPESLRNKVKDKYAEEIFKYIKILDTSYGDQVAKNYDLHKLHIKIVDKVVNDAELYDMKGFPRDRERVFSLVKDCINEEYRELRI